MGYCWAHVANARRVANDHAGANEAFVGAWDLWRAGADAEGLLHEWRLLDIEASLCRAERRFPEALELLDRARAGCRGDPLAVGRILLKKEHAFNQRGDVEAPLAALTEATPLVEASGDRRLLFAMRFNMADDLNHLERFAEAAALLPQLRELAVQQGNELDLLWVRWLEGRIEAGQGGRTQAAEAFAQVRTEFASRGMGFDAALATLNLAALYLGPETGPTPRAGTLFGSPPPLPAQTDTWGSLSSSYLRSSAGDPPRRSQPLSCSHVGARLSLEVFRSRHQFLRHGAFARLEGFPPRFRWREARSKLCFSARKKRVRKTLDLAFASGRWSLTLFGSPGGMFIYA